MSRHPPAPARLDQIRPLGARLTFVEREWLPNLFRRVGFGVGASASDIARWCGLTTLGSDARRRLGHRVNDSVCRRIEAALGFTAEQLQTTVMSSLPDELISLGPDGIPRPLVNWTRGAGTRFCVQCLRERPGVFYTHWRLWWCFICVRHQTVLRGVCPSCHGEIFEASATEQWCRDPTLCWAKLEDGSFCLHPLTNTWDEDAVDNASPMLQAQLSVAHTWASGGLSVPRIPAATLRGTAIALQAADDVGQIAELARISVGDLAGLFDDPARIGITPPREPLAMAALVGAAYRLITDPELTVRSTIRHIVFARTVRITEALEGPGSARYLLNFWPGVDARMRGRILRSIDEDLPPIQRLVHGSPGSPEVHEWFEAIKESRSSPADRRDLALEVLLNAPGGALSEKWGHQAIPRLLWPSWAAPLGIDDHTEPNALQAALADALRIAGTATHPDVDQIAGIGRRLRPQLLGNEQQTTVILRTLCDLALLLRARPGPIDYGIRRRIPHDQLLLDDHWQALCASVGDDPGKHRRLLNARRYAYLRMSAAAPSDLPPSIRFNSAVPDDVAAFTQFILTMSAELKVAIDEYLVGWLNRFERLASGYSHHNTAAPIVAWHPPRIQRYESCLSPELDDIDLPRLHELLANGLTTLGRLAHSVHRTPRHVRWAIAAHPLPSGSLITPIDWARELASLPDYLTSHSIRSTASRRSSIGSEA